MTKRIHWLIERGVIGDDKIEAMAVQLDQEGIGYDIFRTIPFSHDIADPVPQLSGDETVICYGSTSAQGPARRGVGCPPAGPGRRSTKPAFRRRSGRAI